MKRVKCFLLFLSVLFLLENCFSQNNISAVWLINSLGDDWDVSSCQILDQKNNLFLAGNFTSTMMFGEHSDKLSGKNSLCIIKITNKGEVRWIKQISSTKYCNVNSIGIDSTGSIYICGNFLGEMNLGGELLISEKKKNAFIYKLDNSGVAIWGNKIEGVFQNKKVFLANDENNNLFFTGSFTGQLVLNDELIKSENFTDIIIAKFNESGDLLMTKTLAGKANDFVNAITADRNNEIILTGSFENDLIIGDSTLISNGNKDGFLLRMDNKLQLLKINQIGGAYNDFGKCLSVDKNNNLLLSGSFTHKIELNSDHFLESNGKLDVFLIKFDSIGKIIWSNSFGASANDYVRSMACSKSGNIYLTGNYRGQMTLGDIQIKSSEFSNDIFLAKYSPNGDFRFMESIGNMDHDFGREICLDSENYIYLSGNYSNLLEVFDKESKPSDSEEFFISKLYDCDESKKVILPADTTLCAKQFIISIEDDFDQYFWNEQAGSNELKVDSTGLYVVEAIDEHHCFSSDSIFVQLNKLPEVDIGDTVATQQGEIISLFAPFGMQSYLWNDHSTLSFLEINTEMLSPGEYKYWVVVTDDNECVSSDEVLVEVIGNETILNEGSEINAEQGLIVSISPVPAKDNMIVYLENIDTKSKVVIQLYTIEGVRVIFFETHCLTEKVNVNLQVGSFETGSYMLKIINGHSIINKNIIINN